jgi:hypothetical protein
VLVFTIHGDTMIEHAVSLQERICDHHRRSADQLAVCKDKNLYAVF